MTDTITHILPPGKYAIGDPCYCFSSDTPTWDKLVENWYKDGNDAHTNPISQHKGKVTGVVWGASTAYGDGAYFPRTHPSHPDVLNHFEFGVDSGMLGAVSVELMEEPVQFIRDDKSIYQSVYVLDCPQGLTIKYWPEDGTFKFNDLVIYTQDSSHDDII